MTDAQPPRARWGGLLAAGTSAALVALALWTRRPWLVRGLTSDEVANVVPGGPMDVWNDPETAVNPPLLRWLMQLGGEAYGPEVGRVIAITTGLLAVPLAARAGAANGSWWGGVFAGLLVAAHPLHAMVSAEARAYAPWAALVLAHALWLGRVVERGREDRRAMAGAALTAALLPWTHYMAVPMVAASGLVLLVTPGRRWALGLLAPAALAALPLVPWVLAGSSRRTPPMETLERVFSVSAGMGLAPPLQLASPFAELWRDVVGTEPVWPLVMTGSVAGFMLIAALAWRWLAPAQRVLWAHAVVLVAALVAVATFQHVRPPTVAVVVVAVAPVLGGLIGATPWWGRGVLAVVLAAWFGSELPAVARDNLAVRRASDLVPGVARLLRERALPGPVIHVWPSWQIPNLYYTTTRVSVAHAHVPPVCGQRRPCVGLGDGPALVGVLDVVDGAALDGVLVATDIVRDPKLGAACRPLDLGPDVVAWSCGGGDAPDGAVAPAGAPVDGGAASGLPDAADGAEASGLPDAAGGAHVAPEAMGPGEVGGR